MTSRQINTALIVVGVFGVGALMFLPGGDFDQPTKVVTPLVESYDASDPTTTVPESEPSTPTVPDSGPIDPPDPNAVPYRAADHPQPPPEPAVPTTNTPRLGTIDPDPGTVDPPAEDPPTPTTTTICVDKPGTPGQPPEKYCY